MSEAENTQSEVTEDTQTAQTKEKPAKKEKAPAKPKVERVQKNGVTKPKEGTKTGQVWEIADAISAKNKQPAPRKEVLDACADPSVGINPATAATQYGKWRTFHGLVGDKAPKGPETEKKEKAPAKAKTKKTEKAPAEEQPDLAPAPAAQTEEDGEV